MEHRVQSVDDALIGGLSYKLKAGASYVTDRRSVSFFASGGNQYSSTGVKVMRFNLSSSHWMDPSTFRIMFQLWLVSEISSHFFGTRFWRDEILIVSPRLGGRNINFNPGVEILVVEILIVSPRLGGRNMNFNPGIETLESRLWRACPVPGLFPVPGLCRLSGCFLNVYSITPWFVIICYVIFCSTALYYNMLFVIYYVLRMRLFIYATLYFIT